MGTKNKLIDLNNHLFEQLERLNDDNLKGNSLDDEIHRANAMSQLGAVIVNNSKVALAAIKLGGDGNAKPDDITKFLGY